MAGTIWVFGQENADFSMGVPNLSLLEKERQLRSELEKKIQSDILDPILGRGKAMVFVSIELDVVTITEKMVQSGLGVASKSDAQSKLFADTEYVLPGIPKPKTLAETPTQGKSQQAKQERGAVQEKTTQKTVVKKLEIVIFHDEKLAKDILDMVKQRIVDALRQFTVKPGQVIFKPTPMRGKITDDLSQPTVYVPSLFALLVFLFLLFLFGPLASFMRGYVRLLERREGTEVNVESEFKSPEDNKGGAGGIGAGMGALEGEMGELGKEGEGDEDKMEKFEPFRYINDENIKGLIYIFKREEPWVISIVLTYLKPEYTQKVLVSLPVELQARVAMETAIIREVSREQVEAIDREIKKRADFVIGGIEPLLKMLDEAKADIRESILEYLKNEKPEVYEKLRKRLLLFEDIPTIPDKALALILRELKPSELALALKGASPEIENKIFSNLSSGAVNLVKEEFELLAEVTPEEIERERQKIFGVIKKLEMEGKINFREKPQTTLIEGIEEDEAKAREREQSIKGLAAPLSQGLGSAPKALTTPDELYGYATGLYNEGRYNEAAEAFYQAVTAKADFWDAYQGLGNSYYALGKFAEALQCYEQVLAVNPTPELEEFVQTIRAQVNV